MKEKNEEIKTKKTSKKIRRLIIRGIKWELLILGILLLGKRSYEKSYEDTRERIEMEQAEEDYHRLMLQLEKLSFQGENMSEEIANRTDIQVAEDELYQEVNEILPTLQTREEIEEFVGIYLPIYMARHSSRMIEKRISFEDGQVLYKGEPMRLDADSMTVIGNILESIEKEEDKVSKEELEAWREEVLKQIVMTELYDVEFASRKRLILNPKN